jgi:hypothetical protein
MRVERIGLVGAIAGVVLGGLVAAAGCDGTGDTVSAPDEAELHGGFRFHRGHFGRDAGSMGGGVAGTTGGGMGVVTGGGSAGTSGNGAADGGAVADCDICTQAKQCCDVVQTQQPGCTFSAATCSSMVGDARPAYVNACLVFLNAVRGTWGGNPPAECR